MNLNINQLRFKKGKNLILKSTKDGLNITNNSNNKGFIVFIKPIFLNRKTLRFSSTVEVTSGKGCEFKLLNIKMRVMSSFEPNEIIYESNTTKFSIFGITVFPNSKMIIKDINADIVTDEEKDKKINNFFSSSSLLICPGYPSDRDKYNCAFIHTRVKEYKKLNIGIDIAHVNDQYNTKTVFSNFEGINVIRIGFNDIRKVLRSKKYNRILIHFFNERHAQILDSLNLSETKLYFYLHGAETLYWDWPKITTGYFKPYEEISKKNKELFYLRDKIIKKYNNLSNVHWMFVTPWTKHHSEELLNIKYKNSDIIPCYVDSNIFKYTKKDPALRKKIFVIRPFRNVSTYAIDIDVKVILELSRRKIFKDLEFDIYGDGEMFEILTYPLKQFSNVNLHKEFLSHRQISEMHKSHGIGLFATRYDSQAISCCESALSGCVVVSTNNPGITQEIYPKYNTLCDQENYIQYADVIERLYNNPEEYLQISKSMSEDIQKLYSYENTIGKELEIFKKDDKNKSRILKFKNELENPILTVLIPAYNVSEYLDHTIYSLLNQKNSNKIEILVVNDGSTDNTLDIAKKWENITRTDNGSIVKVINKQNGGHGSTINVGIKQAKGKYFRILDGDDTFDSQQFEEFINILEKENSDLILTDLVNDYALTNTRYYNKFYNSLKPEIEYNFDDLCYKGYGFKDWGPVLSTSTYKTEKLREKPFKLTEKIPYDDMEFNFFSIMHVDKVKYYPMYIYNYLLGRPNQSVSDSVLKNKCDKHEIMTINLIKHYNCLKEISFQKQNYLKNNIVLNMIATHYLICADYFRTGKKFRKFDKIMKKYPNFYNEVLCYCDQSNIISSKKIKILRKSKGFIVFPLKVFKKIFR